MNTTGETMTKFAILLLLKYLTTNTLQTIQPNSPKSQSSQTYLILKLQNLLSSLGYIFKNRSLTG